MKKLLIYFPPSLLKPVGGPAGYLYNLRLGLESTHSDSIEIEFYEDAPKSMRDTVKHKNLIPQRIRELRRAIQDIRFEKQYYPQDSKILEYDFIHFHTTDELYLNRRNLKDYKGKVILTSHSPCAMHIEKLSWLNPTDYKLFKRRVERIEEIDAFAFSRADYIIFPCEEAEEPYYNTWKRYASIRQPDKYRYVPTGIKACTAKISREEFRKKYNIPENAFLVSYAGRHNEIKGYADLKVIGEELLKDENVYFIIAGKEEPLKGLNHERWIEVGWTDDPHSLIAASDVFVLPNRETFFDLILLEVISLGVPVVMSNTGGNKYFKRYNASGFEFYDNLEQAISLLKKIKSIPDTEKVSVRTEIQDIFNNDFTIDIFAQNYLKIVESLVE